MKTKDSGTTTFLEKLTYSVGNIGENIIFGFMGSFLTLYYTDSVLISAAFVGTLMLVCRFFDAFSDIAMGMIIEKTNTRWGKSRPWVLISAIPLSVAFILLFHVPDGLSDAHQKLYITITYFFLTVIMFTMTDLAHHSMLSRISRSSRDRNVISAIGQIFALVTNLVISVISLGVLSSLGGTANKGAWSKYAFVLAVIAGICILISFFGTKEKVTEGATQKKANKNNVREGFGVLLKTPYFYIAIIVFILGYICSNAVMGTGVYYAREVLGNESYYSILAVAYVIPSLVGVALSPKLFDKIGKVKTVAMGAFIAGIIGLCQFFVGANWVAAAVIVALRSFMAAPVMAVLFTLAPDLIEYIEDKTGKRYEGLATSANSFGCKVGQGLGSAILGWGLAIGCYDGALAAQPGSAVTAITVLTVAVPAITTILGGVAMLFWKIERR